MFTMRATASSLLLALAVIAGAPALAHAQADAAASAPATDGKAAFQRAVDELAKVNAIMYDAKMTVLDKDGKGPATSMLANFTHDMNLSITQLRVPGSQFGGWIARAKGTFTKDKAEQQLDVAWKSASIDLLRVAEKKVKEEPGKAQLGPGVASAMNARLPELFGATPFSAELGLSEFTLEGEMTIGGEVCDIVAFTDRNKRPVKWGFARSDGLPRFKEVVSSGYTEGITRVEITNLRADRNTPPDVTEDMIKVDVPEGFVEDRKTAVRREVTPVPQPAAEPAPGEVKPADMQPVQPTQPAQPEPAPVPTGPKAAAEFELSTPAGEKVKLADLKGSPIVLQFFGSWCLPCKEWNAKLAPAVKAAGETKVFALSVRERDNANATSELAASAQQYTHLVNADEVAKLYDVSVYPTTVVIDAEGMIRLTLAGETSDDAASQVTDTLRNLTPASTPAVGERASK
ncbi:MAG TPA: redoxin domain-containing protein [Phycisphaerales bacterium]|nr:redoxin domain-containing protein [Phycisphaerales bacterium]